MNRLTYWDGDEKVFAVMNECRSCDPGNDNELCGSCEYQTAANARLAAYEDTGLSPEEILGPVEMAKVAIALKENTLLRSQLAEVTAERDAAVADMKKHC